MKKNHFILSSLFFYLSASPCEIWALPGDDPEVPKQGAFTFGSEATQDSYQTLCDRLSQGLDSKKKKNYFTARGNFKSYTATWMKIFGDFNATTRTSVDLLEKAALTGYFSLTEENQNILCDTFDQNKGIAGLSKSSQEKTFEAIDANLKELYEVLKKRDEAKVSVNTLISKEASSSDKLLINKEAAEYQSYSASLKEFLQAQYIEYPRWLKFRLASLKFNFIQGWERYTLELGEAESELDILKKDKKETSKKDEYKKNILKNKIKDQEEKLAAKKSLLDTFKSTILKFFNEKDKDIKFILDNIKEANNKNDVFNAALVITQKEITDLEKNYQEATQKTLIHRMSFFAKEHAYYQTYIPEESAQLLKINKAFQTFIEKAQTEEALSNDALTQIRQTAEELDTQIPDNLSTLSEDELNDKVAERHYPTLVATLNAAEAAKDSNVTPSALEISNVLTTLTQERTKIEHSAETDEKGRKLGAIENLITRAKTLDDAVALESLSNLENQVPPATPSPLADQTHATLREVEPHTSETLPLEQSLSTPHEPVDTPSESLEGFELENTTRQRPQLTETQKAELATRKKKRKDRHIQTPGGSPKNSSQSMLRPSRLGRPQRQSLEANLTDTLEDETTSLQSEATEPSLNPALQQAPTNTLDPQTTMVLQRISKALQGHKKEVDHDYKEIEKAQQKLKGILENTLIDDPEIALDQAENAYDKALETARKTNEEALKFAEDTFKILQELVKKGQLDLTILQDFESEKLALESRLTRLEIDYEERESLKMRSYIKDLYKLGLEVTAETEKFLIKPHFASVKEATAYIESLPLEETLSDPPATLPEGGFVKFFERKKEEGGLPPLTPHQLKALKTYDDLVQKAWDLWQKFQDDHKDFYKKGG